MPKQNDLVTKEYFGQNINQLHEKLDWLIGHYRNHDEEHTLLNGKVSEHSDRLEAVEEKLGIQV